jgi:hypothetical protein
VYPSNRKIVWFVLVPAGDTNCGYGTSSFVATTPAHASKNGNVIATAAAIGFSQSFMPMDRFLARDSLEGTRATRAKVPHRTPCPPAARAGKGLREPFATVEISTVPATAG